MLLPYRCKNPPEKFPYATIGLIAVNCLVYLFTINGRLVIKEGIVADYAVSPSHMTLLRLLTSMFLHGEPLHIGGNMLFLWLFGAALEGRMGVWKYLLLYFVSGIVGGIVQCGSESLVSMDIPGFGASGAIMGLAGAYLYTFPFARIMVFRIYWIMLYFRFGPAEWLAWWVVAYYMGLNVLNAIIQQSLGVSGGTAYFAHIGGFLSGLLMALLLQVRRDSRLVSKVQATRTDLGHDFSLMHSSELAALLEHPTDNMDLVLTYCEKVSAELGTSGEAKAIATIEQYKQPLLLTADPGRLAKILLRIQPSSGRMSGPFYLKLGGKLEQVLQPDMAAGIYRRIYELYNTAEDSGAALMRLGRLSETVEKAYQNAVDAYQAYVQYFPNGPLVEDARRGIARLTRQTRAVPMPRRTITAESTEPVDLSPTRRRPPDLD